MKFIILIFIILSVTNKINAQERSSNLKLGLGSSFFNINENFDDIFIFNNSSPVYASLSKNNLRIETITNISLLTNENEKTFVRGSLRLGIDYFFELTNRFNLYTGSQYGINTNETHLINLHIGGEYFLHKNWSISNQLGLNFLFDNYSKNYIQTNSTIILRFYLNIEKEKK